MLTTRYQPLMTPRWYWRPFERMTGEKVHAQILASADAGKSVLLDKAQELGLDGRRDVGNLIHREALCLQSPKPECRSEHHDAVALNALNRFNHPLAHGVPGFVRALQTFFRE